MELALTILAVAMLVRAWTWTTPERAAAWAARRGVDLDDDGRRHLVRYLRVTRRTRTIGWVAPVWVVSVLLPNANVVVTDMTAAIALIGYAVGLAVGEVPMARTSTSGHRMTELRPRRVGAYTIEGAIRYRLMAATALLLGAAVHRLGQVQAAAEPPQPALQSTSLAAWATRPVIALMAIALVEVLRRWIVSRPQSGTTTGALAADDAVRTAGVQMLIGIQVAIALFTAGGAFFQSATLPGLLGSAAWMPLGVTTGIVCVAAGAASLVRFGPGMPFHRNSNATTATV